MSAYDYLLKLNFKQLQRTAAAGTASARGSCRSVSLEPCTKHLQCMAKLGPLFPGWVLAQAKLFSAPKPVVKWWANLPAHKSGPVTLDIDSIHAISDWVNGDPTAAAQLQSMTWDQAVAAQQAWHNSTFKVHTTGTYLTKDVVQNFDDGWTMVEIKNREDLKTEGDLMGHCVGGDSYWHSVQSGEYTIYSLRDPQNRPHVTIQTRNDDRVIQCYGKQNTKPIKKYNPYLVEFFETHNLLNGVVYLEDTSDVSASTWAKLTQHPDISVRSNVAMFVSVPEVLVTLAKDTAHSVRFYVASNAHTPDFVLNILAYDDEDGVRRIAAINPSTPVDALRSLASDSVATVRFSLVRNSSIPPDVLRVLAEDTHIDVRNAVARCTTAPSDVLDLLSKDANWTVRSSVAANPTTPGDILVRLASYHMVRIVVARNPSTPEQALRILAKFHDVDVRVAVASNPSTPKDVLDALACDPNADVRNAAAAEQDAECTA